MTRMVDLSQRIHTGMPAWAEMGGTFGLARSIVAVWEDYEDTAYLRTHGATDRLFRTCHIVMSDNGGTHVDGTYHFDPLGERIAEVPLAHFCADGVVLDLSHLKPLKYDPVQREVLETDWITPEALGEACARAGVTIRKGDVVLIRTGASRLWPRREYHFHFVPMRVEAVDWLIDRGVTLFGFDQITLDIIPGYDLPHKHMRKRYSMHMENLTNLDRIGSPRFRFIGFPLKWEGAPCSPLRAFAVEDAAAPMPSRLLDLSHPIAATPSWAAGAKHSRSVVAPWSNIFQTKLAATSLLSFNDHVSTHIDAPAHFHPGGTTIDRMPPDLVVGAEAVWLDLSGKAPGDPITPADLEHACRAGATSIQADDVVCLYTASSRRWGQPGYHASIVPVGPDALRWLLGRGVRVIGVDEDEFDADQVRWPAHRLLREHEFFVIENLALWPAILELPRRFRMVAAPLAIEGATAAPCRAVALIS
jgi:kynurenine formamidase